MLSRRLARHKMACHLEANMHQRSNVLPYLLRKTWNNESRKKPKQKHFRKAALVIVGVKKGPASSVLTFGLCICSVKVLRVPELAVGECALGARYFILSRSSATKSPESKKTNLLTLFLKFT